VKGAKCEFVHMTDKVKEAIQKTKAGAHCARFSPRCFEFDEDYLHFLTGYGQDRSHTFTSCEQNNLPKQIDEEPLCPTKVVAKSLCTHVVDDHLPELIDDEQAEDAYAASITKAIADGKEIHFYPSSIVPDEGRGGKCPRKVENKGNFFEKANSVFDDEISSSSRQNRGTAAKIGGQPPKCGDSRQNRGTAAKIGGQN